MEQQAILDLLDTFPQFDPDFTNEDTGFYCVAPNEYPNAWTRDPHYKGKNYPGDCWQHFATYGEVEAHRREAHPVWYADEVEYRRSKLMRSKPAAEPVPFHKSGDVQFGDEEPDSNGMFSGGRSRPDGPTPEQLLYLVSLAEQKGVPVPGVETKDEASVEITRLKALPDKNVRRNKYDAECWLCKANVPAGEGALLKEEATGRWIVQHIECPELPAEPVDGKIPDGFYAVTADAGHTSFYKVTKGRVPGVVFVDLLVGGGAGGTFQRQAVPRGNRQAILDKIRAAGVEASGQRFFNEAGRCRRCSRGLTREDSRKNGYGKDCAELIGL